MGLIRLYTSEDEVILEEAKELVKEKVSDSSVLGKARETLAGIFK